MTKPATPPDACELKRAAEITGIPERTIRYWADTGKIWKGYRRHSRVYVSPSEVLEYDTIVPATDREPHA